jgi:hypothetical protein
VMTWYNCKETRKITRKIVRVYWAGGADSYVQCDGISP